MRSEAITGAEQASEPLAEERPEASVIPRTNNPKIDTLQRCAAARPLTPMSGVGVAVGRLDAQVFGLRVVGGLQVGDRGGVQRIR